MPRLITYGCSFTDYKWSTWADILAENCELDLYNRGLGGCGNNFIFARLKQDMALGKIQKNDIIRIMWCYYNRVSVFDTPDTVRLEDRMTPTTSNAQVKNFKNMIQYIKQSQDLLQDYDYDFMTWLPLKQGSSIGKKIPEIENYQTNGIWHKPIHPPLIDVVFNGNFINRTDLAVQFSLLPKSIVKNIQKLSEKYDTTPLDLIRKESIAGDYRYQIFFDFHPTPLMHLEYLQHIYPNITWNQQVIDKISQENQQILSVIH